MTHDWQNLFEASNFRRSCFCKFGRCDCEPMNEDEVAEAANEIVREALKDSGRTVLQGMWSYALVDKREVYDR